MVRLDGIDPYLMVESGGRIAHCATVMWVGSDLYVFDSQGGWWWPSD
jgi:hypothetical protein